MRTTLLRRLPSPRTLGWLSALAALSTALLGCPDALHLNAGAGGGASAGSGSGPGSGGSAPQVCVSNPDCTYPTAVCDTVKHACVECLLVEDCAAKPSTVCSLGKCTCPDAASTFCSAADKQPARCVDTKASQTDCGSCGYTCFGGCTAGVCNSAWAKVSEGLGSPAARTRHVAVWDTVDKLMIVWGGMTTDGKATSTGSIYDPSHNTWTPMTSVDAPEARFDTTAVWDAMDHQMIVWGGMTAGGRTQTGGRFDPQANVWKPIIVDGKTPTARVQHSAVWTTDSNGVMLVWGGSDMTGFVNTGAYYDPTKDAWTTIPASSLSPRGDHTAVWDGSQMLVWGGVGLDGGMPPMTAFFGDGAGFSVTTNQWTALPSTGQPSPRSRHSAVWTAKSMLVFGGNNATPNPLADGGQYTPGSWFKLLLTAAPEARQDHTAVWIPTSSRMIVWGGEGAMKTPLNTGYSLDDGMTAWKQLPTALTPRARHTAVVADTKMIIWGGDMGSAASATNTGGIFDANAP